MTILQRMIGLIFFLGTFGLIQGQNTSDPAASSATPLDGVVQKHLIENARPLSYSQLREADLFWEKKIWRIVDTRELMNKHFRFPKRSFFTIIKEAILNETLTAYSVETDDFSYPLGKDEVYNMLVDTDTIITYDPDDYEEIITVVKNEMNDQDVQRFRLKEVWYFDEAHSTMKVRILGIAPIIDEYNDNGEFMYERPLFWVYYPDARQLLAREEVFIKGNDAARLTWEDIMEMRKFSSHVIKQSNILDERLADVYSGRDRLLEAEKIEQGIFNFEHDLWSY